MDTKWCTVCDRYIEFYENELYCSEACRFKDAHGSCDHSLDGSYLLSFNSIPTSTYTLSPPASPVRGSFPLDTFQPSSPTHSPMGAAMRLPPRYISLKPKGQRLTLVR